LQANVIPLRRPTPRAEASVGDLVASARAGSHDAQAALFRRYVRLVAGLARRLMPDQPDLDDIVQDVFVRALESLPEQRDADAFSSWLRGITVHVVRNRLRRRRLLRRLGLVPRATDLDEEVLLQIVSPAAPPDVLVELRATYRVVQRLGTDARTAFVLRRLEGLTVPEVAEQIGSSPSTVKRWIAAAEAQLKFELSRAGGAR